VLITGFIAPACPCGKGCADLDEYIAHARHCKTFAEKTKPEVKPA